MSRNHEHRSKAHGPAEWDARFAGDDRERWATPSEHVTGLLERALAGRHPGRAIELGCGPGRHAIWLAERGWQVTAVDFSAVAIGHAREAAKVSGVDVDWQVADARDWGASGPVDLVLAAFIFLPGPVLARAASWLGAGGQFVAVVHSTRNEHEGEAGPRHQTMLYTPELIRTALDSLTIDELEEIEDRTPHGKRTILLRVRAHRPPKS